MEGGKYVRSASHKGLDFKIGLNTAPGYPYDIVPLRNNPVARDSFDYFGEGLLPHFDKYPTWKTAAPHNIRRVTPQNKRCENCHGNPQLFLHESELSPIGSKANHNVIMTPAKELQDSDLENEAQLLTHPGNIQSDNGESK